MSGAVGGKRIVGGAVGRPQMCFPERDCFLSGDASLHLGGWRPPDILSWWPQDRGFFSGSTFLLEGRKSSGETERWDRYEGKVFLSDGVLSSWTFEYKPLDGSKIRGGSLKQL